MPPRRWSRTTFATFVWFFALFTSAHAECAWVLWWHLFPNATPGERTPRDMWTLQKAFATKAGCDKAENVETANEKWIVDQGIRVSSARAIATSSASPTPSTRAGRKGSDVFPARAVPTQQIDCREWITRRRQPRTLSCG